VYGASQSLVAGRDKRAKFVSRDRFMAINIGGTRWLGGVAPDAAGERFGAAGRRVELSRSRGSTLLLIGNISAPVGPNWSNGCAASRSQRLGSRRALATSVAPCEPCSLLACPPPSSIMPTRRAQRQTPSVMRKMITLLNTMLRDDVVWADHLGSRHSVATLR
jgi:hypothetical protein